ncbi:YdcF family protein [Aerococcaceae bacterium DSM 111176]|nr:YdcF family protein [Aerococcaceae bacterium DSM 111176]
MRILWRIIKFIFKTGLTLVMAVVIVLGLINVYVIAQAVPRFSSYEEIAQIDPSAEVPAMVLGAGVINNESPSTILQLRLDEAYSLYESQPERKFIMSGDHREDNYNEVQVMKDYLVEKGIPSEQIYLDHAGYSTYDSLYRAKNVFGLDDLIVVTQGYHLSRGLLLADYLDVDALGLAAPESESTRFSREAREVLARVKDFAVTVGYDAGQAETNYPIDLSESGDLTDDKDALDVNN